jgi:hypothetical protein
MHDCCQGLCCILTNLEERTLLDLLPGRQQEGDKTPHEHGQPPPGRDRQHGHVEALPPRLPDGAATGPYRVDKFHVVHVLALMEN